MPRSFKHTTHDRLRWFPPGVLSLFFLLAMPVSAQINAYLSQKTSGCDSAEVNSTWYYETGMVFDTVYDVGGDTVTVTEVTVGSCPAVRCESQKLLAFDDAADDQFARHVSIFGDFAMVGAINDDDLGTDCGSVYVYRFDGNSWTHFQKLTASDGQAGDWFGWSISISGDYAIIGMYKYNSGTFPTPGAAYVFHYNGSSWVEQQKLTASDGFNSDRFGFSVAMTGFTAIVGAHFDDDNGTGSGSTYVYTYNGTTWNETQKLHASDGMIGDNFGYRLSISGDRAVISAPYDDGAGGTNSGSVYIFKNTGNIWTQEAKLAASDEWAEDLFGFDCTLSGSKLAISAPWNDDAGGSSGAVYVFYYNGTSWSQQAKLTASDAAAGDAFGYDIGLSINTIVVGAPGDDEIASYTGSVYIFEFSGGTWSEQYKLTASDAQESDGLGDKVEISGDHIIAGAYLSDDAGLSSGSAYIFSVPNTYVFGNQCVDACDSANINGKWYYETQVVTDTLPTADGCVDSIVITDLTISSCNWDVVCENTLAFASDGQPSSFFGRGLAIHGNKALIGAERDDAVATDAGAVYAFAFNGTTWVETQKILASDGGAGDQFGYSIAMSGNLAIISSYRDDDNGTEAGAVYFFEYIGGTWIQQQKMLASDGNAGDLFGFHVDLKGHVAVVGANYDDVGFTSTGSAYIFTYDGTNWSETQKIFASDRSGNEYFGTWTSVGEQFILIGASQDSDSGFNAGAAYFFRKVGGSWVEFQKVYSLDITASDLFGSRVEISGDKAFITGYPNNPVVNVSGNVYVFTFNGTSWNQTQKLASSDIDEGDFFGGAIGISGNFAVITSFRDGDDGFIAGAAYLFEHNGTDWVEQQKFKPLDGAASRYFGDQMAFSGDHILVGCIGHDSLGAFAGGAYFFHPDNIKLVAEASVTACDSSLIRGQWFYSSQIVSDTVADIGIACADSIYRTNLTIYPSYSMDIFQTSCDPGDTGVVINNLQTQQLCDSVIITHTTLVDSAFVTFNLPTDTVCSDVASLPLSGGNPTGGTYSGPGVATNTFFPQALPAGSYTLTYTYTDTSSGCEDLATDNILVEEQVVTFNLAQSTACATETSVPLAGGNPLGGVYSGTGVSGNSFNPSAAGTGSHQITYTYTTPSGCVSSATDNFTVESDVTDPVAICKNITIQLDTAGTASIVAADLDDGSSDACSNVLLTATPIQFDCDDIGVAPSVLTVTDLSGNDTTCTSQVTVADTAGNCCVVQQIPINAGWNIISSHVIPDLPDMDAVFADITSDIIILKNEIGAVYFPGVFNQVGDWGIEEGYQVKASNSTTLEIGCTEADPQATPISITAGWNIISYLRINPMDIEIALSGISADIIIAKDETGKIFIPAFLNQIGDMQPGQGYQVKMSNPSTLTYPANE